jgi:2-polyprenyl-3-methyl-5-hydroxy-6-metoxy-1,4-benzoquinol methylase
MTADPKSVDGRRETERFASLGFDRFRDMALDPALSQHERIGFPDAFREGFESEIWRDIREKAPAFAAQGSRILDVGPGCGPVPRRLLEQAEELRQQVVLVDHAEMLAQLPDAPWITKIGGRFPDAIDRSVGGDGFDAILIYSVLQIVIVDANPFAFADAAMALLRPGGQLLIGDIPNVSKLRRFLASEAGVEHHKAYMRTEEPPLVPPFALPLDRIDDGLVLGLVTRARLAGFDAYLLPQPPGLPMANRREDILIVRP